MRAADGSTKSPAGLRGYGGVTVTTARGGTARYNRALMDPWRTAIATSDATNIWIRGHEITSLMRGATFTDAIVLLHLGRLPSPGERRLLDAILIGVADHGAGAPSCAAARLAASGNRPVDLGGDRRRHPRDRRRARRRRLQLHGADRRRPRRWRSARGSRRTRPRGASSTPRCAEKRRLPGLGHRVHTTDPRVAALFDMARAEGVAGDGIAFMEALEAEARARIKPLPMNIDGALAAVLHDMGFPPPAGTLHLHHRPRRRADRGSRRGVPAREADAHQVRRRVRRRAAAAGVSSHDGQNDYRRRNRSRRTSWSARARAAMRGDRRTTTRPPSIGSAGRSPGPAATSRPRPGSPT